MERFREILRMRKKTKTVPFSSKMLGPDDEEEDNKLVDIIKKYFLDTYYRVTNMGIKILLLPQMHDQSTNSH